mgnify:CR=1 FL=1
MKKRDWLFFLIVILSLFFSKEIHAIGISPLETTLSFVPDQEVNVSLTVLNTGPFPMNVSVSLGGVLAKNARVIESVFVLEPGSSKPLHIIFHMPLKMEPGKNALDVTAREVPFDEKKGITAYGEISGHVYVFAPYPGTYATIMLQGKDVNFNEPLILTSTAKNLGKNEIKNMVITLKTFSEQQTLLETLRQSIPLLHPGESKDLTFALMPALYTAGSYTARVSGKYYSLTTEEKEVFFRVGQLFINITQFTIAPYPEYVYKFVLELENRWNAPLTDVYATVAIKDQRGQQAGFITTPAISLSPWGKETLSTFWDGKAIATGTYTAEITLHYKDTTTTTTFPFIIEEPRQVREPVLMMVMIIAAFVVIEYVWLRKRNKTNSRRRRETGDYRL